jgi:hypothetical protein
MKLSVPTVAEISRSVALEHDPNLEVIGVVLTEGAKDRAEVVVRIRGCHPEPCRLMVNVDRQLTRDEFTAQLGAELRSALQAHRATPNT